MLHSKTIIRVLALTLFFFTKAGFGAEVIKGNHLDIHAWSGITESASTKGQALGLSMHGELHEVSSRVDRKGQRHIRYQQYFKGMPVFGKQLIEHRKHTGVSKGFTGSLVKQIHADIQNTNIKISSDDALTHAKSLFVSSTASIDQLKYENESSKLVIFLDKNSVARQAFHVTFFVDDIGGGNPTKPSYLLDAYTLEVLKYWNDLQTADIGTGPGGNEKIGIYEYGIDFGFLDVIPDEFNINCEMINANVKTVNLNHETSGNDTYVYGCPNNTFQEINGAYSPLNDAHYFGGVIYDMFNDWYSMPPLSFQLVMRVHFGNNYQNAFWNGSSMTFGDGGDIFYPLVSLDVSAHEVAHGFTQQNSNLIYSSQSGGMNEAFSDMTGEAAEFYSRNSNDWQLGADIFKGTGALRYMDDPTLDGKSTGHVDGYYEGMDVHHSSGIYNKAFYLLATTSGWDIRKAFDTMVFANMNYWVPDSTFAEGACGVVSAADDLGYESSAVVTAFAQVGVTCGVEPTPQAPIVTSFADGTGPFVSITGEHLVSITSVTFGGTPAMGFQFVSPTQLTAIKPSAFTTGPICVTNSEGTGCSPEPYYGMPVIDSYTQWTGPFVGINGNNLTGVISVTFNGVPAMGYQEQGVTQLATIVPIGVSTGPICVTTIGGSACSPTDYIVPPYISSVVHGTGPFFTINGTNLVNVTAATFNGQPVAGWQENGPTQLAVIVFNATSGPVTVTTPGGTATYNYVAIE